MRLPFRRLSTDQKYTDEGHHFDKNTPAYLLRHSKTGTPSIFYQSSGIIVKTSLPKCQDYLENEVKVYQHLMKTSASKYIPIFHGYFGYRNTKVIILSDEESAPLCSVLTFSNKLK
jgi:hypothetical protein